MNVFSADCDNTICTTKEAEGPLTTAIVTKDQLKLEEEKLSNVSQKSEL